MYEADMWKASLLPLNGVHLDEALGGGDAELVRAGGSRQNGQTSSSSSATTLESLAATLESLDDFGPGRS